MICPQCRGRSRYRGKTFAERLCQKCAAVLNKRWKLSRKHRMPRNPELNQTHHPQTQRPVAMRRQASNLNPTIEQIRKDFVRLLAKPDCPSCGGAGEKPTDRPEGSACEWYETCGCLRAASIEEIQAVTEQYRRAGLKVG